MVAFLSSGEAKNRRIPTDQRPSAVLRETSVYMLGLLVDAHNVLSLVVDRANYLQVLYTV